MSGTTLTKTGVGQYRRWVQYPTIPQPCPTPPTGEAIAAGGGTEPPSLESPQRGQHLIARIVIEGVEFQLALVVDR